MDSKVKTTVYLDALAYRRLKEIAAKRGSSAAEEIREAVAGYLASAEPAALPRSLAAGSSGRDHLSEDAEELLRGLGSQ